MGLLYADDLVVIVETKEDLIKRLNEWKDNVENRGMRVNMSKNASGDEIANVNFFATTSYLYMQKPAPRPIEPTS